MKKLPIIIHFNNYKMALLFILALGCTIGSLYVKGDDENWMMTLIIGLLGIVSGVFLFCLLNYRSYYLKITEKGVETKTLLKSNFFEWDDVTYFSLLSINFNRQIVFGLTDHYFQRKKVGEISKLASGKFGGISSLFDMNSRELVALLNECKQKYSSKTL